MGIASRDGDTRKGLEKQAQEFETWYRGLVERVPAVLYVDASDEINSAIYVSPQVEVMLGYAPHEWISDPELWVKTLHPDDRQQVMNEAARTRETGEVFCMEYRLVARDGRVVWIRDEATPVSGENGLPRTWQGVLLNITERKWYEEELRRSEERHRLVARATGEAIWDNDLLTGKQEWAGATEALFGYSPHEGTEGAWWEERIHPADRERVLSSLEAVYEGDEEAWAEEYRFRRADGSYAVVVDRGYVVRDGNGKPVRMVGSMRDVTERREMQDALKESEKRFRTTFEAAAVGMARISPDGRWREVNGNVCEILGYEREELLGMTFWELTPYEELDDSRERVEQMLKGKLRSYSVERRYIHKDGRRIWASVNILLAWKSSGEPDYFFCKIEDITKRKLAAFVPNPLTPREMEVLSSVVAGRTDPEISRDLSHSLGTVKRDVRHILNKLGVENRKRAAASAVEIGLVLPPPY